jgi:hypothetical protein
LVALGGSVRFVFRHVFRDVVVVDDSGMGDSAVGRRSAVTGPPANLMDTQSMPPWFIDLRIDRRSWSAD